MRSSDDNIHNDHLGKINPDDYSHPAGKGNKEIGWSLISTFGFEVFSASISINEIQDVRQQKGYP